MLLFFFLLNRQNYKFLLHCQWSCPMHKSVAHPRRPWIIASHGRCYFAETNSSDKIFRRLIVYSCFMAHCNLNTFMISLKSLHEENARAGLRQQGESQALFLHLDSSPPSYSLLPLCKPMEAARIFYCSRCSRIWAPQPLYPVCLSFSSALLFFFCLRIIQICANELRPFLSPLGWKLKVTRRDPRLLIVPNCSKCTIRIRVPASKWVLNEGDMTQLASLTCTS